MKLERKNPRCTMSGCDRWQKSQRRKEGDLPECEFCGFFKVEAARRAELPLIEMPCGLKHKVVHVYE